MHREGKRHILADAAARGSLWTRLSFLVMGAGCIRYKQFVRGAAYLLSEVGFIFFFRDFALQYLSRFATLGTETQRKVWNEELQIFQRVPGDNSMLILLFSVLSIAVCAVFLYLWYANVRDAWRAQEDTVFFSKIQMNSFVYIIEAVNIFSCRYLIFHSGSDL